MVTVGTDVLSLLSRRRLIVDEGSPGHGNASRKTFSQPWRRHNKNLISRLWQVDQISNGSHVLDLKTSLEAGETPGVPDFQDPAPRFLAKICSSSASVIFNEEGLISPSRALCFVVSTTAKSKRLAN
ncbi:hypothetical protein DPEC_G00272240 [Dallia pectoralis]|uniref:Uncharacterized protein n=1 Tax=Dallia pectoralis TaxID=75939 RepID=A0ACC2FPY0_DALPE|nr:hypothetical protein DPEC_G00272240 [Dallia pectoralis]